MRKKAILAAFVLVALLIAAILWPTSSYDSTQVHSSLRDLRTPYRSVITGVYLDGGSIGIQIVDRDSRTLELALPVSRESNRTYPRLFIGTTHLSETGAVEVAFSKDTRLMLISIIEQHRNPFDGSDMALLELRGAPRDYARLGQHLAGRLWQTLVK